MTSIPDALGSALTERPQARGVAIVSARSALLLCRVEGGELVPPPGVTLPDDIYEVRAALAGPGCDGELRFHGPDRTAFVEAPGGAHHLRILLGGAIDDAEPEGWVRLREARIRDVLVPFDGPVTASDRFALTVQRIIDEDEDGNVHVVDEVLRGLERVDAPVRGRPVREGEGS